MAINHTLMRYSLLWQMWVLWKSFLLGTQSKPKACRNSINLGAAWGIWNCSQFEKKQIAKTFKLSIFHCVNSETLNHSLHIFLFPFILCHVITVFQASSISSPKLVSEAQTTEWGYWSLTLSHQGETDHEWT